MSRLPTDLSVQHVIKALQKTGFYFAGIYADAADSDRYPKNTSIQKKQVDGSMHLKATLAPGGCYAVCFVPLQ